MRLHFRVRIMTRNSMAVIAFILCAIPAAAATFIVPQDRAFVHSTPSIVLGSAIASYTRLSSSGSIETVTSFSIDEVLKGHLALGDQIDIVEPGGAYRDRTTIIPGVPRLADGQRYLLFLRREAGQWHVADIALGKFSFRQDTNGHELLMRDEEDIVGWDANGQPHAESRRSAPEFLEFIRTEAAGGMGKENYRVAKVPLVPTGSVSTTQSAPVSAGSSTSPIATTQYVATTLAYSASSYTFIISGSLGARWNVFPSQVNFYSVGTEPGAPGGGTTAITTAMASWNNDPNSNVNYAYAGADTSGTHNGGINSSDGQNTIAFEQNLSSSGVSPFQCSGNSYSGTLGLGGVTSASGTHTGPNGETFYTTKEGDVQMNQGIANCTLLFSNGDFNSAVTHEIGHTLGFRHSDQTRADNPSTPCTSDPSLECADVAIMHSFVSSGLNGALQAWDQHAVSSVYPGASNANLGKTTVLFSDDPLQPGVTIIKAVHLAELRTAVNQIRSNAGLGAYPFTDSASRGVVVKAIHIQELRTALDQARSKLGLSTGGWTNTIAAGVVIKAVHFQEIRNRMK